MPKFLAPPPLEDVEPGPAPTFSVVIPAFQAAGTIAEAVASIVAQTTPAAEIIICDDGSSDDLVAALEPYRDAVRLLRTEHRGVAATRNELVRAAGGEFVVPLDADDVYAPTRLQRLAELAATRPDLDLLSTDAVFVSGGRPVGRFNEGTPFAVERQREAILDRCFLICPAMRRSRVAAVGGYDESLRSAEDWDLCIRLILAGATAGLVDEELMEYRLGNKSLTASRGRTLHERVYMLEKAADTPGLPPQLRRAALDAVSQHRGRALEQVAREAVEDGASDSRSSLVAVARSRDVGLRARIGAALSSVAPARSRRLVELALPGSTGRPRD
jgi:GT2 family glycosyltransferase